MIVSLEKLVVAQPWADCITNTPGFNLRQAQVWNGRCWREADVGKQAELQCPRSAVLSQRQFADVDHARRCQDREFEMICLYDVRNVAREVRDNVDAGPASQAVIEQSRAT
jgi:hypothetical protein